VKTTEGVIRPEVIPHFEPKARNSDRGRQYERYMASPEWRAKKAAYWSSLEERRCQVVDCPEASDLHVHHHTYVRLANELLTDLVGVCLAHHEEIHAIHRANKGLSLTRATEIVTGRKHSKGAASQGAVACPKLTERQVRRDAQREKRREKRRTARAAKADVCPNCKTIVMDSPIVFKKIQRKTVKVKRDCTVCVEDPRPTGSRNDQLGTRGTWTRPSGQCQGCHLTELRPGMTVVYVKKVRAIWVAEDCPYCQKILRVS